MFQLIMLGEQDGKVTQIVSEENRLADERS